jgi:hypothetical protein
VVPVPVVVVVVAQAAALVVAASKGVLANCLPANA